MSQLGIKLTKQIQNSISRYFKKTSRFLTKPESRNLREMVTGIFKSQQMFVNQIATNIIDSVSLKQTTKRFRRHYNKPGFWKKINNAHLESVKGKATEYVLLLKKLIMIDGQELIPYRLERPFVYIENDAPRVLSMAVKKGDESFIVFHSIKNN